MMPFDTPLANLIDFSSKKTTFLCLNLNALTDQIVTYSCRSSRQRENILKIALVFGINTNYYDKAIHRLFLKSSSEKSYMLQFN